MAAPLRGIRVVEFEGIGPAPYAGMLLADLGAEVTRIARPSAARGDLISDTGDLIMLRGRKTVTLNLKDPQDLARARELVAAADGVIEGLRPGAMERLGLGPSEMCALNPRLVYCRITGWGQEGPLSRTAGHDINYIALSGALALMGPAGRPPLPPANLIGDFGGGGLYAAFGLLAGLIEAMRTGRGQVIDSAMLDGAASQMAFLYAWASSGIWNRNREANLLDGGAPFYRCYECACGGHIALGSIEPQFFAAMMQGFGLGEEGWDQSDRNRWPAMAVRIAAVALTRTRDEWAEVFAGTDACVTPVLDMWEVETHPHNAARGTFEGPPTQPAPGPRFRAPD
ncbi:MAG: CaiB/BaiF CoA-transferase family protein [Pseudomonadota bacterium]